MKFLIRAKSSPINYVGNAVEFGTGPSPYINVIDNMYFQSFAEGEKTFWTGLEPKHISQSPLYTEDEIQMLLKKQKDLLKVITNTYKKDVLDPNNKIFWNEERTKLMINAKSINAIFNTDDPDDAILYLGIISGTYPSVAPSQKIAEEVSGYSFYISEIDAATEKETKEKFGDKMEAYFLLKDLLQEQGNDAIIYISYLLTELNKGYTRNTSRTTIKSDIVNYIETGDNGKDKKKCIDNFIKLATLWQTDKETLIGKAIVSAAYHYGKIKRNPDKKLEYKGLVLGSNLEFAYETLNKPANTGDFEELATDIEEILNK